jgi:polygalacturonase
MKPTASILLAALVLCGTLSPAQSTAQSKPSFEIASPAEVVIPAREVCLTDFGGVGDGVTLNSAAFESAIVALDGKGGGRLTVPAGVWYTGPIVMRDNIELHLAEGAMIIFSTDKSLYPIVRTIFEGRDTYRCQSPISAVGRKNIAITGSGIIDGSGDVWRAVKKDKLGSSEWKKIVRSGGILSDDGETWYPSESFRLGQSDSDQNINRWATTREDFERIKDFLRPVMISFNDCDGVLLSGVTYQNSPCWNIHIMLSRDVTVEDISVRCPWYAQNGDGIDIESCDRVVIRRSTFDAGDDAICIKSGKDEEGRRRGIPASNILVEDCTVFHGHGGFVVGSEMSGGARNIIVRNCRFSGTDVGLRFKSTRGRGGVVENIYIENIQMNDIATEALLFDLFYGGKSAVEAQEDGDNDDVNTDLPAKPVDETTPEFRNIFVTGVVCRGANRAMLFNGLPEKNVSNIVVENSSIEADAGAQINESTGVVLRNVKITPRTGPALMVNNVKGLVVSRFDAPDNLPVVMEVTGSRNENIEIDQPSEIDGRTMKVAERAKGSVVLMVSRDKVVKK